MWTAFWPGIGTRPDGSHRFRKDVHHGEDHREDSEATLIISHNKTLAAQLHGEMKEFFPENAVEYFVSYYDYYQPEAYVPSSDTFIEKDASVNEHIEQMRLSATKRCWSGVMWLWWRLFPRFMVWAILIYISR